MLWFLCCSEMNFRYVWVMLSLLLYNGSFLNSFLGMDWLWYSMWWCGLAMSIVLRLYHLCKQLSQTLPPILSLLVWLDSFCLRKQFPIRYILVYHALYLLWEILDPPFVLYVLEISLDNNKLCSPKCIPSSPSYIYIYIY